MFFSDPVMRYNDGKLDPKGRFLVDVMGDQERNSRGGLFAVERDGSFRQLIGGTTVANGLGFSPNGETLYFIDTPTKKVMAYAYSAESGTLLSEGRAIVELTGAGSPDGMCVDAAGQLWVAEYGGGRVGCWNPEMDKRRQKSFFPAGMSPPAALAENGPDTLVYHDGPMSRGGECPLGGRTIPSEDLLLFKDLIRRPPVSGPDFFWFFSFPSGGTVPASNRRRGRTPYEMCGHW